MMVEVGGYVIDIEFDSADYYEDVDIEFYNALEDI